MLFCHFVKSINNLDLLTRKEKETVPDACILFERNLCNFL